MLIKFAPRFTISAKVANALLRIEAAKERILYLPATASLLATLRETARLYTTHYSTMIEGNRLEPGQIEQLLKHEGHFPGREREESEVRGYYTALEEVEKWAARGSAVTEILIKTLHAIVMAGGRQRVKPSPYRDGQNLIRDSRTRTIVYMPPEAKDVSHLMAGLVAWIAENGELPAPLVAGIVHYQFATIHPYYDGNGRTARLLTTLVLHLGGYDLKGLYSLEEYYARNLGAYYDAITIGPSHNYYMGRAESDITSWIEYFIEGMASSFENVLERMSQMQHLGLKDQEELLRKLSPKQRRALDLFRTSSTITARQVALLFGFQSRTSTKLCADWVEEGFLEIANPSNKNRSYRLAPAYESLITS